MKEIRAGQLRVFDHADVGSAMIRHRDPMTVAMGNDPQAAIETRSRLVRSPVPFEVVCFETLTRRAPQWLWDGYIPAGSIIGLTGEVGTGKSLIVIDWFASITAGKVWSDGKAAGAAPNCIIMTAEDDLQSVVLPRLEVAGADLH